jgi:hypothetical protein
VSIGLQRNRLGRLTVALVAVLTAIALVSTATAGASSGRIVKSKRPHRGKKHKGHGHRYRHRHGAGSSSDGLDPALSSAFSLFRTPPEGLPRYVSASLAEPNADTGWGLEFPLSQRVQPNPLLPPAWAIPGDGYVCIEVSNGPSSAADPPLGVNGLTCTATDRAVVHGTGLIVINNEGTWSASWGLVPDGVNSVTLKGNPVPVPVIDNVFAGLGQWSN